MDETIPAPCAQPVNGGDDRAHRAGHPPDRLEDLVLSVVAAYCDEPLLRLLDELQKLVAYVETWPREGECPGCGVEVFEPPCLQCRDTPRNR